MNIYTVNYILSRLSFAMAAALVFPLILAVAGNEPSREAFTLSVLVSAFLGVGFRRYGKPAEELTAREGIAITAFGWFTGTFLGMLPYFLGNYLGFLDALFESISGFTGTGATVFSSLGQLPYSILFWRMMTAWIGGLGIIVIFIALLPQSGASTIYMYNAEGAGPTMDRVMPRLRDMTMALFKIYLIFTAFTTVIFMLYGVEFSIAVTHAMSTIGTCGFSTYDDSTMHFQNLPFELWTALFMFLAGGSFSLYYRAWVKGPLAILRNTEFRTYLGMILVAMLLIALNLIVEMGMDFTAAVRFAIFQVTSLSTTGFVSADFETWPTFSKLLLLLLMAIGGCAGSTASGIKVARIVLLVRNARAVILQKLNPHRVVDISLGGAHVDSAMLLRVGTFFFLYLTIIFVTAFLLTMNGLLPFDAVAVAITTLGNIGPAFGIVSATSTYAPLSDFVKTILCIIMLLGRLEIFTLLILLRPSFWRKTKRW
ncbi:TrkH family potassium uptake protein [uncultured Selenomonas sp.]|uniref:TrkH family potassium uptake protein n=1 Tax=uncultured Selenomonas sp. TaxID=159275 RepID=UPI0028DD2DDC|nr:TrkH family potassium uptake protein [uncultured Selenomonas sp.]